MEFWLVIFKERNPHAFEAREQKAGCWDEYFIIFIKKKNRYIKRNHKYKYFYHLFLFLVKVIINLVFSIVTCFGFKVF
jgi:hypothetical protein